MVVTSDRVASNSDSALALPFNGEPISAVAAAATNNLLDDQYFASPKRKDCRLMKAHENLSKDKNGKANGGNSTKSETDRIIGKLFEVNFQHTYTQPPSLPLPSLP